MLHIGQGEKEETEGNALLSIAHGHNDDQVRHCYRKTQPRCRQLPTVYKQPQDEDCPADCIDPIDSPLLSGHDQIERDLCAMRKLPIY